VDSAEAVAGIVATVAVLAFVAVAGGCGCILSAVPVVSCACAVWLVPSLAAAGTVAGVIANILTFCGNSGNGLLFRRNMMPQRNVVNHNAVYAFGIYLRTSRECGTGNTPTSVVLRIISRIPLSSSFGYFLNLFKVQTTFTGTETKTTTDR
jgi:hypothetical protein